MRLALIAVVAAAVLTMDVAVAASTHVVVMEGVGYAPATLTVKRGDTIVWRNKDPYPHTVTAKGAFDSGSIAARTPGVYPYLCTLHPTMTGTLTVR
jgi:plastocyanin